MLHRCRSLWPNDEHPLGYHRPNCAGIEGLACECSLTMQAVMRWTSGISLPQNIIASPKSSLLLLRGPRSVERTERYKSNESENARANEVDGSPDDG